MIRPLYKIISSITIFISVIIMLWLFLISESGLKATARVCGFFMPNLTIKNIHGSLANHFEIEDLSYDTKNYSLRFKKAELSWNLRTLIFNKITIKNLTLSGIELNINQFEKQKKSNYNLPIQFDVQRGEIINANLIYKKNSIVKIQQLLFSGQTKIVKRKQTATINIAQLSSQLANTTLTGSANFTIKPANLAVHQAYFQAGKANIKIYGYLNQNWNFHWQVNIPNLHDFLANSNGSIQSSGKITGFLNEPNINAITQIANLNFNNLHIKSLVNKLQLHLKPTGKITGELLLKQFKYKEHELETLAVAINGTTQKHTLTLQSKNIDNNIAITLNGGLFAQSWQGTIQKVFIASNTFDNWQSVTQPMLKFNMQQINLANLCLRSSVKNFCGKLQWQKTSGLLANISLHTNDMTWLNK